MVFGTFISFCVVFTKFTKPYNKRSGVFLPLSLFFTSQFKVFHAVVDLFCWVSCSAVVWCCFLSSALIHRAQQSKCWLKTVSRLDAVLLVRPVAFSTRIFRREQTHSPLNSTKNENKKKQFENIKYWIDCNKLTKEKKKQKHFIGIEIDAVSYALFSHRIYEKYIDLDFNWTEMKRELRNKTPKTYCELKCVQERINKTSSNFKCEWNFCFENYSWRELKISLICILTQLLSAK